jgi:hypothetical protein
MNWILINKKSTNYSKIGTKYPKKLQYFAVVVLFRYSTIPFRITHFMGLNVGNSARQLEAAILPSQHHGNYSRNRPKTSPNGRGI